MFHTTSYTFEAISITKLNIISIKSNNYSILLNFCSIFRNNQAKKRGNSAKNTTKRITKKMALLAESHLYIITSRKDYFAPFNS